MEIKTHEIANQKIAEILSDEILLNTLEDGLDLLGNLYYQGFERIIIYEKIVRPIFLI